MASEFEVKINVYKNCNTHSCLEMVDWPSSPWEKSMQLRIECSEYTDWYPTIYVFDSEDDDDYIHKYTFPKQFCVEK